MSDATLPILDHLVLPTADLGVARRRLSALGFTVAAEGIHPFGTHNACVYFEDGTFIEPLAVNDAAVAEAAIADGNVFVERDRMFRQNAGEEGLSAVVLASRDTDVDHARFEAKGISAGSRLDFSRGYRDAEGVEREVSFRLAFAAQRHARASFFFTCERVNAPARGRGALAVHGNGVTGIARVIATSSDVAQDAAFLSRVAGGASERSASRFELPLSSCVLEITEPRDFAARFGTDAPADGGELRLAAIVFSGADTASLERRFPENDIRHLRRSAHLVVPRAGGQGATFIFEDLP